MIGKVKHHTPGKVRYFTYYLVWPDGSEPWVDQVPFVHDLQWELKHMRFMKDPLIDKDKCAWDLLYNGECRWTDKNDVTHRIVIDEKERKRNWGTNKVRIAKGVGLV